MAKSKAKKSAEYCWEIDYRANEEDRSTDTEGSFTEFTKEVKELLDDTDVTDIQISIRRTDECLAE